MKKSHKFITALILFSLIGLAFIGIGIAWPYLQDQKMITLAKDMSELR